MIDSNNRDGSEYNFVADEEINNILSIIEITNQCPELKNLYKLSIDLKNELCERAKIYFDDSNQ